jgi:hypothetical protein
MLYSVETKDPNSTEAFELDWTPHLGGSTLASSDWTVPPGITLVGMANTDATAIVTLSNGTVGQRYRLVNQVDFEGGGTEEWTLDISVEEVTSVPTGPPYATLSEAVAFQPLADGEEPLKIDVVLRQSSAWIARLAPRPKRLVTTLTEDMDATQDTIPIPEVGDWQAPDVVRIDDEVIYYAEIEKPEVSDLYTYNPLDQRYPMSFTGPGNLASAIRGRNGTTPTSHDEGATVEHVGYPLLARDAELAVFEWLWASRGFKPSRSGVLGNESYSIDPAQIKELVKQTMGRFYTGGGATGNVAIAPSYGRIGDSSRRMRRWTGNF